MNEERMSKRPVIVDEKSTLKLERIFLNSKSFQECWMQELLEKEPSILPSGNVNSVFAPLVFLAREVETPSGFIDNLYISAKGYVVIVETKLWRNPEARREVVGQILDYAKEVKGWDYEKINSIYMKSHNNEPLFSKMLELNYQSPENEAGFIDVVEKNLKSAKVILMIVGDGIRESVEKLADFLNSSPNMQYHLALCELEVYDLGENKRLVIPQLTTKTKIVERGIIRVEEASGEIVDITMHKKAAANENCSLNNKKSYHKSEFLSLDEWIESTFDDPLIKGGFLSFLTDFEDLGITYRIGTSDMILLYPMEIYNTKLKIFQIYGDGKSIIFQPIQIYNFLDAHGFSSKIADDFFESLREFLSTKQKNIPYERLNGYYNMDISVVIENKDEILKIFEKFKSNFQ